MRTLLTFLLSLLVALCCAQTICIDPGHPSENGVGTQGKHVSELHAAWAVALRLERILKADGYTVTLTKSKERQTVTNKARAEVANDSDAALMLRLHCDAGTKPGLATYYPGAKGKVKGVTGPSDEVLTESKSIARVFHRAVIQALNGDLADRGCHTEASTMIGARQGALTGSIYSRVPVLLVEMAVLQNEHDDAFIASTKGQEKVAEALAHGVEAVVPRR